MSPCTRCDAPSHVEYIPTQSDSYDAGDIIVLNESIHIPVEEFYRRQSDGNDPPAQSRRGSNSNRGKPRPGIVFERRPIDDRADGGQLQKTVALLLATFDGEYHLRAHLPLVLQHLCVPVHPHSEIANDPDASSHIHTSPEWSNSKKNSDGLHAQWLIMHRCVSRGPTSGRWKNAHGSDPQSSFRADERTFAQLTELLEEKWEVWAEKLEHDPDYLLKCKEDYILFKEKTGIYSPSKASSRCFSPTSPGLSRPPAGARSPQSQAREVLVPEDEFPKLEPFRHNDAPPRECGGGRSGPHTPRTNVNDPSASTEYLNFSQLSLGSQSGNGTAMPPPHSEPTTALAAGPSGQPFSTEATTTPQGNTAAPSSRKQRKPRRDKVKKK